MLKVLKLGKIAEVVKLKIATLTKDQFFPQNQFTHFKNQLILKSRKSIETGFFYLTFILKSFVLIV